MTRSFTWSKPGTPLFCCNHIHGGLTSPIGGTCWHALNPVRTRLLGSFPHPGNRKGHATPDLLQLSRPRCPGLAAGAFCPRTRLLRCFERDHGAGPRRGLRCENGSKCQITFAVHVARSRMPGCRICRPGQTLGCGSARPVWNVKFGDPGMHSERFLTNPGTFVTRPHRKRI